MLNGMLLGAGIIILLLISIKLCASNKYPNPFDNPKVKVCLDKELSKCGKEKLPEPGKGPYTDYQQKILACRIKKLAACLELDRK